MNNEVLCEYMNSNNNDVRYVLLIMLTDRSDLSRTVPYCSQYTCYSACTRLAAKYKMRFSTELLISIMSYITLKSQWFYNIKHKS
jgi:hypothetical protein